MNYPYTIQNLINHFSKLPAVGPKTAERYVFYLLKENPEELQKFAQSIAELKEKIIICKICLAISEKNPCAICSDHARDRSLICAVASIQDMIAIESTGQYKGLYHILGGVINAIENINPDQLSIKQLINRLKENKIKEIIIALSPTFEGETTAMYLKKIIDPLKIKTTRLAKGLPMGASLEYADEITISNALKYRN